MFYPCTEALIDGKNCSSKRVSRACDRCRLKKTKCDGRRCCNRCLADDAICVFSKRKRSSDRPYNSEYVQLLEDQQMKLVEGVQELYRKLRRGEGWTGPKIAEDSQGYPLVQDVLDSLAVLAPCERSQPKKKPNQSSVPEQGDEEEEAEQSPQCDGSSGACSMTPPLTSLERSQSPDARSLQGDCSMGSFTISCVPNEYQQSIPKPISLLPNICQSNQSLPDQDLQIDDSVYWPLAPSYDNCEMVPGFPEFIDPFSNLQTNCDWYQESYGG